MLNKTEQEIARLMKRARQIAREGNCAGWTEVVAQMKGEGLDVGPLKSSSHAAERTQLDALCVKAQRAKQKKSSS
jgi:hypothetical protein